LDSNHSEEHVLNELSIYSKIVSKGSYLIVLDTTIEYIDNNLNTKKNLFMRGNNPLTAVKKFLKKNKKFKIEKNLHEKSFVSNAYSGFLKKVK
jgi:cephalosporin hydroxylase